MKKSIEEKLVKIGQNDLLAKMKRLDAASCAEVEAQLEKIDLDAIPSLIEKYVKNKPSVTVPDDLSPAPFYPFPPKTKEQNDLYYEAAREGERLLREGKVAALTVAGGQGTRLGFDGPKGTYPITPVKGKTLFQYFAESIGRASEKFGGAILWFIMTSRLNDAATRKFFKENSYFGLAEENVIFFTQGVMPAISYEGNLLLASKNSLALAPDGHGGTLLALRRSGCLDKMKARGIEYLSYFQVDNPLCPVVDPLFIGLHHKVGSQISCRMLPKTNPYEKLGNFCVTGGRLSIIEYSDMPSALAEQKNPDGTLAYVAGSPAIHVISRAFAEKLTEGGKLVLPWHRADKKVGYLNNDFEPVVPEKPNAVKLESFIFDAIPMAEKTMVLEGARAELFGPTKNATGVDSAESCRAMLSTRDARRLELAGIKVPRKADGTPDCVVELSPGTVFDDGDAVAYFAQHPEKAVYPARGEKVSYGD